VGLVMGGVMNGSKGVLPVTVLRRLDWEDVVLVLRSWFVLGRVLPSLLAFACLIILHCSTLLLWPASDLAHFSISVYNALSVVGGSLERCKASGPRSKPAMLFRMAMSSGKLGV